LESQPVSTAGELADVADRPAATEVSQLEDLDNSQHRAFCWVLLPRTTDPARMAGENLVLFHGRSKDRTEQAVRLGRHRDGNPLVQKAGPPFSDHLRGQLAQLDAAQIRRDVLGQKP